jgi:hypothetical protein
MSSGISYILLDLTRRAVAKIATVGPLAGIEQHVTLRFRCSTLELHELQSSTELSSSKRKFMYINTKAKIILIIMFNVRML